MDYIYNSDLEYVDLSHYIGFPTTSVQSNSIVTINRVASIHNFAAVSCSSIGNIAINSLLIISYFENLSINSQGLTNLQLITQIHQIGTDLVRGYSSSIIGDVESIPPPDIILVKAYNQNGNIVATRQVPLAGQRFIITDDLQVGWG